MFSRISPLGKRIRICTCLTLMQKNSWRIKMLGMYSYINSCREGIPLCPIPLKWADLIVWDQLIIFFRKARARTVGFIRECERIDFFRNRSCTGGPGYKIGIHLYSI